MGATFSGAVASSAAFFGGSLFGLFGVTEGFGIALDDDFEEKAYTIYQIKSIFDMWLIIYDDWPA